MAYALRVPRPLKPTKGIARALREAREAAGISQEALAAKSGVSRATIANIEREENRNPELETVDALAGALGVTRGALLPEGEAELAPLIERFRVSFWNRDYLKPQASDEELAWLRSLPTPARWLGEEPNEETIARMLEGIRASRKLPK